MVLSLTICLWITSCSKEHENPFDKFEEEVTEDSIPVQLDATSIEGLHANIFRPTCANSGCHDGTFEPDFRTVSSTYNTLVYQPIVKNDPQGSYAVRVKPGSVNESMLMARLTIDIDNNSGIMPLAVEPDSDWPNNSDAYIQNVSDWIQAGAKDLFGNSPNTSNQLPQMEGAMARANGVWLERSGNGQSSISILETVNSIELFFAFSDDATSSQDLTENTVRFSSQKNDYENAETLNLQVSNSAEQQVGYFGNTVSYYHSITINPQDYASLGETIYFRTKIKDGDNPVIEIPADAGADYIKDYFSFTIIE